MLWPARLRRLGRSARQTWAAGWRSAGQSDARSVGRESRDVSDVACRRAVSGRHCIKRHCDWDEFLDDIFGWNLRMKLSDEIFG